MPARRTWSSRCANPNCAEPVNFAFLTHDGNPIGPPGPDQQTDAPFDGTAPDVMLMNPGDTIRVSMHDARDGPRRPPLTTPPPDSARN